MISGKEQFERDFEAFLSEDDSRLAALYRKLPRAEPDAKLDAAVLAMAHRTLNPHLVATPTANAAARRRARWLAPLGAAAGLVLAAGVALRVGPQIWGTRNEAAPAAMRDNGVIQVRPVDEAAPPPPASPPPPPQAEPALAAPTPPVSMQQAARAMKPKAAPVPVPEREVAAEKAQQPPAATAPAIQADRADIGTKQLNKVENAAPRAAAPQAFPGQGRREPEMDAVERKQAIATGAWQKLHENDSAGASAGGSISQNAAAVRPAPAPAPPAAAPAVDTAGAAAPQTRAKSVAAPATVTTPSPTATDKAVAPAEEEKRSEGRRHEALQNLELFRKKYPNYHLPADLEHLAAPPK
jgi:hypothetical protein